MHLFSGMTIDPAYASFTEATLGSLEIGKRAESIVQVWIRSDIARRTESEVSARWADRKSTR